MSTKKTAPFKVHQLAKELGVNSKDIVARCQAEEIPDIVSHLSPVSVGLAETIRAWFSSGEQGSAASRAAQENGGNASSAVAELAPPASPRAPRRPSSGEGGTTRPRSESTTDEPRRAARKAVRKSSPQSGDAGGATRAAPTARAPAPKPAAPTPATPSTPAPASSAPASPAARAPAPPQAPPAAAPRAPAAPTQRQTQPTGHAGAPPESPSRSAPGSQAGAPPAGAHAPPDVDRSAPIFQPFPPPVMNVPERPKNVGPVGPKLDQPTKSTLAGPKVIRIEAPEQLPAPRSRGTGTSGPMRVGRTGTGSRPEDRNRTGRASGRRDDTGRSGRLARADRGQGVPAGEPWRPQDLREREDRLSRSEGFFKQHRRDSLRKSQSAHSRPSVQRDPSLPVRISEPITILDLSQATGVPVQDILRKLVLAGYMSFNRNSAIDAERATEIMMEFDVELQVVESKSAAEIIESRFEDEEKVDVRPRAPVVTILGHVDHGKTSLLDRIRNTNVASGEAGGITQATSAFQVPVKAGEKDRVVTFVDTPGHEAFTNMRARGAKVTDVAVLVVAADDGVMPQTVESINHAKAAGVPIVVALNKIDRPEATEPNIRRILGQLAEQELNPTEWGGTTEVIRTSATRGDGIQDLLDMLDYQAELLNLTAGFGGAARGTVLEARMEEGRGPVANVIIQEGTLKKGDFVVIGRAFGRVRDLVNDRGERIAEAGPSTPVAISGVDQLPDAGDKLYAVSSLKSAEEAAEERRRLDRERELAAPKITLDNIFQHLEKGQKKELSLVVKADVQGSVETLRAVLGKIGTNEVLVSVKHCAVGGINESDIALAEATKAIIVGFNVTSSAKARTLAEAKGIEIRLYEVIYDLTDDVSKAASGLLSPEVKLEVLGHADVRQVFKISKVGAIAGCYITDGVVERNAQMRVTRGGIVIEKDRRLEQLKRFKDDVKEVRAGQECGMKIVGYDDIKVGDVLECYKTVQVARTL